MEKRNAAPPTVSIQASPSGVERLVINTRANEQDLRVAFLRSILPAVAELDAAVRHFEGVSARREDGPAL